MYGTGSRTLLLMRGEVAAWPLLLVRPGRLQVKTF